MPCPRSKDQLKKMESDPWPRTPGGYTEAISLRLPEPSGLSLCYDFVHKSHFLPANSLFKVLSATSKNIWGRPITVFEDGEGVSSCLYGPNHPTRVTGKSWGC